MFQGWWQEQESLIVGLAGWFIPPAVFLPLYTTNVVSPYISFLIETPNVFFTPVAEEDRLEQAGSNLTLWGSYWVAC